MRYEVGVEANLTFHTQRPPFGPQLPAGETVVIEFEGRRFVWHHLGPNENGEERWPVATTMVADPNDYAAERVAMERFLSALSYSTRQPIEVVITGGAGYKQEMDPPLVNALRRGLADHVHSAPAEIVVEAKERLMIVLGYYREGLNTGSPFFKFLAFWNALDVACEDFEGRLPTWIRRYAGDYSHLRGDNAEQPDDWWEFLQDDRRSAVAHAVRDPGRGEELDPNDPEDRAKLGSDARLIEELVRVRIRQRWGDHPIYGRPRAE